MAYPQTRLVVDVGGELYAVISIAENTKGSLIIRSRPARFAFGCGLEGEDETALLPTERQKYTVHIDRDGNGNMIHQTLQLTSGRMVETHHLTRGVQMGRFMPIYSHTIRDITLEKPNVFGLRDPVIKIAQYDPKASILHLLVVLGPADAPIDGVAHSEGYDRHLVNFRQFSLIILTAYTMIPSLLQGELNHFSTAEVSRDGEKSGVFMSPTEGLSPSDSRWFAETIFQQQHLKFIDKSSDPSKGGTLLTSVEVAKSVIEIMQFGTWRNPNYPGTRNGPFSAR